MRFVAQLQYRYDDAFVNIEADKIEETEDGFLKVLNGGDLVGMFDKSILAGAQLVESKHTKNEDRVR